MLKVIFFAIGVYIVNTLVKGFFCELSLKFATDTSRRLFLVNVMTLPIADEVTRYLSYLWSPLISLGFTMITTIVETILGFGIGVKLRKRAAVILGLIQGVVHPVGFVLMDRIPGMGGLFLALLLHMTWNDLVVNKTLDDIMVTEGGDSNESN